MIATKFPWEDDLVNIINNLMPADDKVHSSGHSLTVAAKVRELLQEPEYSNPDLPDFIDIEALIAGAYLHDVGYFSRGEIKAVDSYEHVVIGKEESAKILAEIKSFSDEKIAKVQYLVFNHDNAKWTIPNWSLPNHKSRYSKAAAKEAEATDDDGLRLSLQIIKEADSSEYTDLTGTQRTWDYGEMKGIPVLPYPHHLDPVNKNRLSNLLTFPHLAWLNAYTRKGQLLAHNGFIAAEDWVTKYTSENKIAYKPDKKAPALSFI
jgi:HD domain